MADVPLPNPTFDRRPARIPRRAEIWQDNLGRDTAKYLISTAQLYNPRPRIQAGSMVYVWPIGTEAISRSGQAQTAIHRYIGDDFVDVQVIHRNESRIVMSGLFPGVTARANVVALENVLTALDDKILYVPGIFDREQFVVPESWEFAHTDDDRTHSFTYSVTFIRSGTGKQIRDPHGNPPPQNPTTSPKPKGTPFQTFTARVGAQTFRQIAQQVYNDSNLWNTLVYNNYTMVQQLMKTQGVNWYQVPAYQLPLGTKVWF